MAYNYIYVDDVKDGLEKGVIRGLEGTGHLKILFHRPSEDWTIQIANLKEELPKANGLILDLRLNDNPNENGQYAQYRGSSVAQELRTLVKENEIKFDFPIILISANEKLVESLDPTGIDLFDACISKNTLGTDDEHSYEKLISRLISLAIGYEYLNNNAKNVISILGIEDDSIIDIRFKDKFNDILSQPVHTVARFVIKQILERPSFLIDEDYLSARLGVDQSSLGWPELLEKIKSFKYSGIFNEYYQRWWMPKIEIWWEELTAGEVNLKNMTSDIRVEILSAKLNLDLKPIIKSQKAKSSSFWTVCMITRLPIDTVDGFVVADQDNIHPWQEKRYISIEEALRPTKKDKWKDVATLEKKRLQTVKELYAKADQRNS